MAIDATAPAVCERPGRTSRSLIPGGARSLVQFILPVAVIVAWVAVTQANLVSAFTVPGPSVLWSSFRAMEHQLPDALAATVSMTLLGFAIGSAVGVFTGLAMAYSRTVRDLLGFGLDFVRPVPVFALIPLFILWFGIGRAPQITLIALGTSVILGVTTREAVKNVPQIYIRAGMTLGGSRWSIYRTVVVPSIMPHLIGAIRVAAAASWGLDVAAEFIGSQQGLGYLMINRENYLDTAGIVVIVIIYCLLAVILDRIISVIEGRLLRWTERRPQAGAVGSMLGAA